MAFVEDLTEFLDTEDGFAVSVVLDGTTINVIFDHEYIDDGRVSGELPMLKGQASDFASAAEGTSIVVISGVSYLVQVIQPDGTGWAEVVIAKQ